MTVNGLIISNVVIESEMGSHNLFAELKISQTISLVIDQDMSKLVWFLSLGIRILLKDTFLSLLFKDSKSKVIFQNFLFIGSISTPGLGGAKERNLN